MGHDPRIREKPTRNFEVMKGAQGMKEIDPIKVEYPAFYEDYKREMEKATESFGRQRVALIDSIDTWGRGNEERIWLRICLA